MDSRLRGNDGIRRRAETYGRWIPACAGMTGSCGSRKAGARRRAGGAQGRVGRSAAGGSCNTGRFFRNGWALGRGCGHAARCACGPLPKGATGLCGALVPGLALPMYPTFQRSNVASWQGAGPTRSVRVDGGGRGSPLADPVYHKRGGCVTGSMAHQDRIEALPANVFATHDPPVAGNDYVVMGTAARKARRFRARSGSGAQAATFGNPAHPHGSRSIYHAVYSHRECVGLAFVPCSVPGYDAVS
jgi:hypothetical protein